MESVFAAYPQLVIHNISPDQQRASDDEVLGVMMEAVAVRRSRVHFRYSAVSLGDYWVYLGLPFRILMVGNCS